MSDNRRNFLLKSFSATSAAWRTPADGRLEIRV